jgi:hypothetical protein
MPNRTKVFVSYSHEDARFLKRLKVFIKPLERNHDVDFWDDSRILSGEDWREEIKKAIDSCKVAVLLISADFVASDFINTDELPPLLKTAKQKGTVILPVIVGIADLSDTGLSAFQAVNDPKMPLKRLDRNERDEVFFAVSQRIKDILRSTPAPVPQTEFQEINVMAQHSMVEQKTVDIADVTVDSPYVKIVKEEEETYPRFLAQFVTDDDGKPRLRGRYKNHFEIRLFIENAPRDTKQVVYELHDSYPKPIREIPRGRRDFEEYITSYGDYVVNIEILGDRILEMNDWLSSALENFYGKNPPREILEAIKQIEEH